MPEDIGSISSSRLSGADLSRHSFTTVRRGFDAQEVRSFLEQLSRELAAGEQREEDLRRRLAEAEERAEHPVIDEATLTTALGQQSAQVLRNAHEEAARITLQAEETAAALVRDAQRLAAEVQVQAESAAAERIAEAEIARRAIFQQAELEAGLLLETSRTEAEALVARGVGQGQEMMEQAQETRRRVLVDMAHRRRVMTLQIEQFRAARDELAAAVSGVRDSVDAVLEDLARADDSARAAAAEVARRQPAEPTTAEIMAEVEDVETALDVTRARAHETAREQAHGETVEVASAVFDVAVEDPATGATVVEEIEVTVVEAVDDGGGVRPTRSRDSSPGCGPASLRTGESPTTATAGGGRPRPRPRPVPASRARRPSRRLRPRPAPNPETFPPSPTPTSRCGRSAPKPSTRSPSSWPSGSSGRSRTIRTSCWTGFGWDRAPGRSMSFPPRTTSAPSTPTPLLRASGRRWRPASASPVRSAGIGAAGHPPPTPRLWCRWPTGWPAPWWPCCVVGWRTVRTGRTVAGPSVSAPPIESGGVSASSGWSATGRSRLSRPVCLRRRGPGGASAGW